MSNTVIPIPTSAVYSTITILHLIFIHLLITQEIMADFKDVVLLYEKLKSEWTKTPPNLEVCGQLLLRLKVIIQWFHDYKVS